MHGTACSCVRLRSNTTPARLDARARAQGQPRGCVLESRGADWRGKWSPLSVNTGVTSQRNQDFKLAEKPS